MKFVVKFKSEISYSCKIQEHDIGLHEVDQIRSDAACTLPLERIASCTKVLYRDVDLVLVEAQARECGHFTHTNTLEVVVESKFFNKFVSEEVELQTDLETREVLLGTIVPKLDESKIYSAWKEAGFPKNWEEEDGI